MGGGNHVIGLFADDTVLYLTNPYRLISSFMALITEFGKISGLAVNYSKSELHPIALTPATCTQLRNESGFRWVTSSWKHLGVNIPLDINLLYSANFFATC